MFSTSTSFSFAMLMVCAALPIARADITPTQLTQTGIIGVDLVDESHREATTSHDEDTMLTSDIGLLGPVLRLNSVTLAKSLLVKDASEIAQWIVMFCAPWHPNCEASYPIFRKAAQYWQEKLNTGLFTKEVKFADVDCAVDKVLCNSQNVDRYPVIGHYRQGKQVSLWKAIGKNDEQRVSDWLQKIFDSGSEAPMDEHVADSSWQRLSERVLLKARLIWSHPSRLFSVRSYRPTVGSKVLILDTSNTQKYFPSGINQKFSIKDDAKDDEPFKLNIGQDVWLRESDVLLLEDGAVKEGTAADWTRKELMGFLMHTLLLVAAIAGMRIVVSQVCAACNPHGRMPSKTQDAALPLGRAAPLSSVTARCLPQEWGHNRASLEL